MNPLLKFLKSCFCSFSVFCLYGWQGCLNSPTVRVFFEDELFSVEFVFRVRAD